mgnify:CR=1 FL=1
MNCMNCPYYKTGYMYNACSLTEAECFNTLTNCTLVNDDGTINYQAYYFTQDG